MILIRATKTLYKFGLDVTLQFSIMNKTFVLIVEADDKIVYACDAKPGIISDAIVRSLIRSYSKGLRSEQVSCIDTGRDFPHWRVVQLPFDGEQLGARLPPLARSMSSGE